jgi:hypothetical protein
VPDHADEPLVPFVNDQPRSIRRETPSERRSPVEDIARTGGDCNASHEVAPFAQDDAPYATEHKANESPLMLFGWWYVQRARASAAAARFVGVP